MFVRLGVIWVIYIYTRVRCVMMVGVDDGAALMDAGVTAAVCEQIWVRGPWTLFFLIDFTSIRCFDSV